MSLLPAELRAQIPATYSQSRNPDPMVYAKLAIPGVGSALFIIEGQPHGEDYICFGFVIGKDCEFGYYWLSDLETMRSSTGLSMERDLNFIPGNYSVVLILEKNATFLLS